MFQGNESVKTGSWAAPFVAPFLVFMLFLSVESYFPDQHYLLYPFKTALVVGALAWYWRALPTLRPTAPVASAIIGIIAVAVWVGLDPWSQRLDSLLETAFNRIVSAVGLRRWEIDVDGAAPIGRDPFLLYPAPAAWILFVFRTAGIALCVPVMEELFWRGFLMRWLIADDFTRVPLGTFTPFSFWAATVCFALVHGAEWPLAIIVGTMYGFWFVRTKALGDVMIAHGTTNLLLAFYCLFSGDWHFLSVIPPEHK